MLTPAVLRDARPDVVVALRDVAFAMADPTTRRVQAVHIVLYRIMDSSTIGPAIEVDRAMGAWVRFLRRIGEPRAARQLSRVVRHGRAAR